MYEKKNGILNRGSCMKNKIIEKLKKANNQSIYTRKLLQQCKTWGGPAASMEELYKNTEITEKVVRTEVSYYRDTYKTEISYQPHLFKVNRITHEEGLTTSVFY